MGKWEYFPKELAVSLGNCSGSVNADMVTAVGASFNDNTCLVPLARVLTSLVLYCHVISWEKGRQQFTAPRKLFRLLNMSLAALRLLLYFL